MENFCFQMYLCGAKISTPMASERYKMDHASLFYRFILQKRKIQVKNYTWVFPARIEKHK